MTTNRTPAEIDQAMARFEGWCNHHCYHCGRTFESIAESGPTASCLCSEDNPDDPIPTA